MSTTVQEPSLTFTEGRPEDNKASLMCQVSNLSFQHLLEQVSIETIANPAKRAVALTIEHSQLNAAYTGEKESQTFHAPVLFLNRMNTAKGLIPADQISALYKAVLRSDSTYNVELHASSEHTYVVFTNGSKRFYTAIAHSNNQTLKSAWKRLIGALSS